MYSLYLEEAQLDLYKSFSSFESSIDCLDFDYFEEGAMKELFIELQEILDKYINAFIAYCSDIKELFDSYLMKKQFDKSLKIIKKALTECPDLNKEKIRLRAYAHIDGSTDNTAKVTPENILNSVKLKITDEEIYKLLQEYNNYKAPSSPYIIMTIEEVLPILEKQVKYLDTSISDLKTKMKNLPDYFLNANRSNPHLIKSIVKSFQRRIDRLTYICIINIDLVFHGIHEAFLSIMKKDKEVLIKNGREPSATEIVKSSKKVKDYEYFGDKFEVFESNYENISCLNMNGKNIYVNKNFFKMPKAYQDAILFHEIGHYKRGHFSSYTPSIDESKIAKQIKKDKAKLNRIYNQSEYFNIDEKYKKNELIYVLLELEADRYASNIVGKHHVRTALTKRFNNDLDKMNMSKDLKDYNRFRMKVRTKMI